MKITLKSILKRVFWIGIIIYFVSVFIKQQTTLNMYKAEQEKLTAKIEEQKEHNATLISTKENINSPEFIEEIAREKLDMYLPNERVYIDIVH